MLMAAACYNLKKLLKFKEPNVNASEMNVLKKTENELENAWFFFFAVVAMPDGWYYKNARLQLK